MSGPWRAGDRGGGDGPGREAVTGAATGRREDRRRAARGAAPPRQAASARSYYGRPVVKPPVWRPLDIAGYLWLGGLAGGSSLLALGARLTGRPRLARATTTGALGAIGLSTVALVHDLGRPERFPHMLRVCKPTSPMSVGSWLLAGYGPLAGLAAVSEVTGRLPRVGAAATAGAALLGPAVASYTAVLVADTAVPAWHGAYRELPFVFTGSAAMAAGGLGMLAVPVAEAGPARRAAVFGAALELAASRVMHRRLGLVARPLRQGRAGALLRAGRWLGAAGATAAALAGGRGRAAAAVAGLTLLAGSAAVRFGVFHAGVASAADPVYTVVPQRERLRRRAAAQRPDGRDGGPDA